MSRLVVLFFVVAICLVAIIAYPIANKATNDRANSVDEGYLTAAEKEAKVLYLGNYKGFTAVFDTESKKFIDEKTAKKTVNPYGTSKEHQGKYLLITVDDNGDVTSEWITP